MATQMNGADEKHHSLRVIVFDNLRNRSHIFTRLFSQHPQFIQCWHPYVNCTFFGPDRITTRLRHGEARHKEVMVDQEFMWTNETYGSSTRALEERVAEAEKAGKSIWVNEHCAMLLRQDVLYAHLQGNNFTTEQLGRNPTNLPDWLFETCTPIIIIRHPALQVESLYRSVKNVSLTRPGEEDFDWLTSLRYCRLLFDLFKAQGRTLVVVDGEDVISRTKEMTTNVCKAIGVDPSGVKETWEPTPETERHSNPIVSAFLDTIYNSTGVQRPSEMPEEPLNMEKKYQEMVETYGQKAADELKFYVERNMEDYEYLKQFKV